MLERHNISALFDLQNMLQILVFTVDVIFYLACENKTLMYQLCKSEPASHKPDQCRPMSECTHQANSVRLWHPLTGILPEPSAPLMEIELDKSHHKYMVLGELLPQYIAVLSKLIENDFMTHSNRGSVTDEDDKMLPNSKHLEQNSQPSLLPYRHTKFKECRDSSPSSVYEHNGVTEYSDVMTSNIQVKPTSFEVLIFSPSHLVSPKYNDVIVCHLPGHGICISPSLEQTVDLSLQQVTIHMGKSHLTLDPGGATPMKMLPIVSATLVIINHLFVSLQHFTNHLKHFALTLDSIHNETSRWSHHHETHEYMLYSPATSCTKLLRGSVRSVTVSISNLVHQLQ